MCGLNSDFWSFKLHQDVQWTDIDYMDAYKDWTYDHKKFMGLPDVVKDLHKFGMKYVMIVVSQHVWC